MCIQLSNDLPKGASFLNIRSLAAVFLQTALVLTLSLQLSTFCTTTFHLCQESQPIRCYREVWYNISYQGYFKQTQYKYVGSNIIWF